MPLVGAAAPTVHELVAQADAYVGADVKGKVIDVHSDKSVGGLTPGIWTVTYYDPDAAFKTAEVKLGDGRKLEVGHPLREPLAYMHPDRQLNLANVSVDPDKAVRIAREDPLLKDLKLRATQLWLDPADAGPEWKVRLWAAKMRRPDESADIGDIYISADTGKVVKEDLHLSRAD